MRSKEIIIVSALALIDNDKKILLNKRPDDKFMSGFWEFPGGKKEKNETPSECLIREIKEEIGINIKDSDLSPITFASHEYDDFSILLLLFSCREWNGILVAKENQELGWFSPLDLYKLELLPADKGLIPYLEELVN
ncbi:MAG: (deoxy)nucleoside triphosphate pyrophosphohydrolase [Pseudomonadota bacterium]|nr:(deoxy)nucleoside triphosphate pyrophosphohydrolase [Pseudomonadota bacterium]